MFRTGYGVIVSIPCQEYRWLQDIQRAGIMSCEAEWLEFGGGSGSDSGSEVGVGGPLVIDDLKLLFERYTGWTRGVDVPRSELQKNFECLRE